MFRQRRFNLLRSFSVSSFVLVAVIGATIITVSRQMMTEQLVEAGESANVALANSIVNAMWSRHADYVKNIAEIDGDATHPDLESLPEKVDAVVLEVPKGETADWVRKAADAGISDVWIHMNRDTPEALAVAEERGLNVLTKRNFSRTVRRMFIRVGKRWFFYEDETDKDFFSPESDEG